MFSSSISDVNNLFTSKVCQRNPSGRLMYHCMYQSCVLSSLVIIITTSFSSQNKTGAVIHTSSSSSSDQLTIVKIPLSPVMKMSMTFQTSHLLSNKKYKCSRDVAADEKSLDF